MGWRWVGVLAPALLLVALAGCRAAPPPMEKPVERPAQPPGPAGPPAAGVYFLHEQPFGVEECLLIGERVTGAPDGADSPQARQARTRAVLDLAEQAGLLGGNVVLLPRFSREFSGGRLTGRVYRCDAEQRREIHRAASAARRLTVIQP